MTESRTLSLTGHTAHAQGPNQPKTRFQASGSEGPWAPLSAARSWPGLRGHNVPAAHGLRLAGLARALRTSPTSVQEAGGAGGEQGRGHGRGAYQTTSRADAPGKRRSLCHPGPTRHNEGAARRVLNVRAGPSQQTCDRRPLGKHVSSSQTAVPGPRHLETKRKAGEAGGPPQLAPRTNPPPALTWAAARSLHRTTPPALSRRSCVSVSYFSVL